MIFSWAGHRRPYTCASVTASAVAAVVTMGITFAVVGATGVGEACQSSSHHACFRRSRSTSHRRGGSSSGLQEPDDADHARGPLATEEIPQVDLEAVGQSRPLLPRG